MSAFVKDCGSMELCLPRKIVFVYPTSVVFILFLKTIHHRYSPTGGRKSRHETGTSLYLNNSLAFGTFGTEAGSLSKA